MNLLLQDLVLLFSMLIEDLHIPGPYIQKTLNIKFKIEVGLGWKIAWALRLADELTLSVNDSKQA